MIQRRTRIRAASEDMRKLGVTLMIAGIVGSAFKNQVPVEVASIGGLLGLAIVGLGIWITPEEPS